MKERKCPACNVLCENVGEYDSFWPRDYRCPKCGSIFDGDTGDCIKMELKLTPEEYEELVENIKSTIENDNSIPIIGLPEKKEWDKSQQIRFKQLMSGELKHGTRLRKLSFKYDLNIITENFSLSALYDRKIVYPTYADIENAIRGKKVIKWTMH